MDSYDKFLVEWDDRYCVGVKAIDQQHRFLILKIRALQKAMAAGETAEALGPLIHNLGIYTRFHFAFEERLFVERGFKDIRRHQESHAGLAQQVAELESDHRNGMVRTGAPVVSFLLHWLVEHILGEDLPAFGSGFPQ